MPQKPSIFVYGDENFSTFEKLLKSWSFCSHEIWRLRVDIHQLLADPSLADQRRRFKYGFLTYFPWLFQRVLKATLRSPRITTAPDTDFLILICGAASKEFEILAPIVRALLNQRKTVGIAWFTEDEPPLEIRSAIHGAQIWQIRPDELWLTTGMRIIGDIVIAISRWLKIALRLSLELQGPRIMTKKSTRLVDRFVELRVVERYLNKKLSKVNYAGIGLASDTSTAGAALARVCLLRGWQSHHFLHGPPDLVHARSMATDLYCFSKPEVDFLVKNGCSPNHVFACGHPSQAGTISQVAPLRTQDPEEGGLRLLYAAQPAIGSFDAAMHREVATLVIEAAKKLALTHHEFRIRIHPGDDPSIIRGIAASILGDQYNAYLSTETVAGDLAWANVLTTLHSTMALQATYVDVQIVWLFADRFRYGIRDAFINSGFGIATNSLEELVRALSHLKEEANRSDSLKSFRKIAGNQGILTIDPAGACANSMQKSIF